MHTFTVLSVCSLAVALTALPSVHAVPKYAKLIPNGNGVTGVNAVGHTDPESGGATNAFGKAFAAADNAWTEALCKADSDGDGQTNGEELGDPCCAWKSGGGAPAVATGAKDPGSATSKLDDAALTASRALCGAAPAAGGAGTVKPAEGATNATPALTPGAPGAAPAAPAAAPGAPAAAPGAAPAAGATPAAAASGSGEYDWVPMDQVNKTKSGSTTSAATTPSATSAASSATNATKNATSSAMPSPLSARSSLVQVVAAAVVGVVALAL